MKKITIGPGDFHVTTHTDEVIATVLGSCVAACIRDPEIGVGGMNHFMLPESNSGVWGNVSANMRYGNFAMETLINEILRNGGDRRRLEVKVFGGATMMANGARIGPQNADFVENYLRDEGRRISAGHLRGEHARRIEYFPPSGRVRMLEMPLNNSALVQIEKHFFEVIHTRLEAGSTELF